jgi:YXWGXW repeat-containing protein
MFKRLALIGTLAVALTAVAMPAHAASHVSINVGIGAPVYRVPVGPAVVAPVAVVAPAPYPGYVWQPAHYVWTPYGYQMVPGMWVPAPYVAPPAAYVAAPVVVAPRPGPPGLALGVRFNAGRGHGRRW